MLKTDRQPLDASTQVEEKGKYTHYIYESKEILEAEAETLIKLGLNPQYYKEVQVVDETYQTASTQLQLEVTTHRAKCKTLNAGTGCNHLPQGLLDQWKDKKGRMLTDDYQLYQRTMKRLVEYDNINKGSMERGPQVYPPNLEVTA